MESAQNTYIAHVQKDFFVKYHKLNKVKPEKPIKSFYNQYSISYIFDGVFKMTTRSRNNGKWLEKSKTLSAGNVIISEIGEENEFKLISGVGECIIIDFLPLIFQNTSDEKDIFRIFKYNKIKSVFNIRDFSTNFCLECLNSIRYCLETDKGRFHTLLRIKNLVSQLDFELDLSLGENRYVEENILIKTINYIKENYAKNLTLDLASEYLGISKSSINRICKKMENKTFGEFLTDERLRHSIEFLENPTNNVKTVAILCGFNSYNAFYHAFVKKFGYPPSKNAAINQNKYKRVNWPFETSTFDFYREYE